MRGYSLSFGAVFLLAACGTSVDVLGPGAGGTGAAGTTGGGANGTTTATGSGAGNGTGTTGSGTGTTGSGAGNGTGTTGSTGTTTGGGNYYPPSEPCWNCVDAQVDQQCWPIIDKCEEDLACGLLIQCYEQCDFTQQCVEKCNDIVPSGVPLMKEVMGCIACTKCFDLCEGSVFEMMCP